jgi:hypothetical protein
MAYRPTLIDNYERMGHDQALEYSLDLLELALINGHYGIARVARESIAAIWRHRTSDFGTMFVAMVMHGRKLDVEEAGNGGYLEHGVTYEREGGDYLATWSLHS